MGSSIYSQAVLESMLDQVYVRDLNMNLLYINPASERLTGWNLDEVRHKKCYEIFGDDAQSCKNICPVEKVIHEKLSLYHHEGELKTRDGAIKKMKVSISPMSENGEITGGIVVMQDITDFKTLGATHVKTVIKMDKEITERKQAEQLLKIQRDLGTRLGLADNLMDALKICLDSALMIGQFECGGIYLFNPEKEDINLIIHKNLPASFVEGARHFDADSPQVQLIKKGRSVYENYHDLLSHMALSSEARDKREEYPLRSIAIVPVVYGNKIIGAMNVASKTKDDISKYHRYALESIADQVSGRLSKIESEQTLKESQENLKSLFQSLNDFLFVLDSSGKIIDNNSVVAKRLGYTKEELSCMTVLDVHPPERKQEASEIVAQMLEGKRAFCPIPLQCRDGSTIPVETKITLGKWNNQDTIFGISRDISDRIKAGDKLKKALKEKEALLKEVHHRVKNNMQVVSSLLSLQADKHNDSKVVDAFLETEMRVQSMAIVHEILYQSDNFSKILLQEYLGNLTDHLANAFMSKTTPALIEVDAKHLFLKLDHAFPCGLVVAELVTNAFKYAIPPDSGLLIRITAIRETDGNISMTIADNGSKFDQKFDPENSSTLGLRIVTGIITDQLEGRFNLTQADGVCWTIEWPG